MRKFLILRATVISFLWFVVLHLQAQPSQNITPLNDTAKMLFEVEQKDISFNDRKYRLYIAQPKNSLKEFMRGPTEDPVKDSPKDPQLSIIKKPVERLVEYPIKRPVLYILDGNGQFPMLLNLISELTTNTPIIVGIGYQSDLAYPKERTHDYTVPLSDNSDGGGAEQFYQFISQKVKPYIEANYNVDTLRQTLAGHSHGGQFVLYTAFNHPESFNNYVSGSASLWWGNGAVIPTNINQSPLSSLSRQFSHSPHSSQSPRSITIALGEYEENPDSDPRLQTASPEIKKMREQRRSSISHKDLALMISREVKNCRYIVFEGKNHGSSIPEFLKEALNVASVK